MQIANIRNQFISKQLAKSIEKREGELLKNEALLASMFLDARYISYLTEENTKTAKELLIKIWVTLNKQINEEESIADSSTSNSSLEEREVIEILIMFKIIIYKFCEIFKKFYF